jgi:hypothetical protein
MTSPEKDFAEKALDTAGFAKYAAEVGDQKGIDTTRLQEPATATSFIYFLLYRGREAGKGEAGRWEEGPPKVLPQSLHQGLRGGSQ